MEELFVTEVMTKNVTACAPDTPIKDVIKILSRNRISSLIITENNEPVGIITERDLVAIMDEMLNSEALDHLPIVNFMTSPALTVHGYNTFEEAVKFAINKNIRHLPVVDQNNKLIGLLTQTNMVKSLSYITYTFSKES